MRKRTLWMKSSMAIMDPCSQDMMGTIYACEALRMQDKGGRKYNRAYRKGLFGQKK